MNIVDIGPECFADEDLTVISYKGMMYYRACSAMITDLVGGGMSFCVKRIGHPGDVHENFEGMTWHPHRKRRLRNWLRKSIVRIGVIVALASLLFAIFLGLLGNGNG